MREVIGVMNQTRPLTCKESEFLETVIEVAHLYDWIVAHFRASRTKHGWVTAVSGDGEGFPDLFMLRPTTKHRATAELKVGSNKPTEAQNRWLDAMETCGIPAFVWTPGDWDEIESILKNGAT